MFACGSYATILSSEEIKLPPRSPEVEGEIISTLLQRVEHLENEIKVLRAELEDKTFSLERSLREVQLHVANFSDVTEDTEKITPANVVNSPSTENFPEGVEPDRQILDKEQLVSSQVLEKPFLLEQEPMALDPDTLYRKGADFFKTGFYLEAIEAYSSLIKDHPTHTRVGDATYRLGEAYYELRFFQKAILQYERLIELFPENAVKPNAMLKLAYCYYEIGEPEESLAILERIKLFFPGSKAAELSEGRLKRLMFESP
ncbi:tetratricopeptide repeat protein [Gammaproteobacteria bacterium]|nr:tetratricopeptide repeat protein [Gammaproteobacteria bacterium]